MSHKPPAKPVHALAHFHAQPPHRLTGDFEADKRVVESLRQSWGPNLVDATDRKMKEILAGAGMPTEAGTLTVIGRGNFRGLDRLAVHLGHRVGSEVWYAATAVEWIARLHSARAGSDRSQHEHAALRLGALLQTALIDGRIFDHGLAMRDGPKRPRQDALARQIVEVLVRCGPDISVAALLDNLREAEGITIDQDDSLDWRNDQGRDKTTTFKTLQNRLPRLRKEARKLLAEAPQK